MDNRYSLLKDAMVRNIKEYNDKFKAKTKSWKWTPLLPYIILVVNLPIW
jgi:S-DNA-T family DNA segregation ATPase FtsK/SpoIIIE